MSDLDALENQLQKAHAKVLALQHKKKNILDAQEKKRAKELERKVQSIMTILKNADDDVEWNYLEIHEEITVEQEIKKVLAEFDSSTSYQLYNLHELLDKYIVVVGDDADRYKRIRDALIVAKARIEKEWGGK